HLGEGDAWISLVDGEELRLTVRGDRGTARCERCQVGKRESAAKIGGIESVHQPRAYTAPEMQGMSAFGERTDVLNIRHRVAPSLVDLRAPVVESAEDDDGLLVYEAAGNQRLYLECEPHLIQKIVRQRGCFKYLELVLAIDNVGGALGQVESSDILIPLRLVLVLVEKAQLVFTP